MSGITNSDASAIPAAKDQESESEALRLGAQPVWTDGCFEKVARVFGPRLPPHLLKWSACQPHSYGFGSLYSFHLLLGLPFQSQESLLKGLGLRASIF